MDGDAARSRTSRGGGDSERRRSERNTTTTTTTTTTTSSRYEPKGGEVDNDYDPRTSNTSLSPNPAPPTIVTATQSSLALLDGNDGDDARSVSSAQSFFSGNDSMSTVSTVSHFHASTGLGVHDYQLAPAYDQLDAHPRELHGDLRFPDRAGDHTQSNATDAVGRTSRTVSVSSSIASIFNQKKSPGLSSSFDTSINNGTIGLSPDTDDETDPLLSLVSDRSFLHSRVDLRDRRQLVDRNGHAKTTYGTDSVRRQPTRIYALDLLRGLIMIIMAWDHAKDFLSNYRGLDDTGKDWGPFMGNHSELWYGPLELYHGNPGYLFARQVSHICAPMFSFLMGCGIVLHALSRQSSTGWSSWRLLKFHSIRGLLLVAFGFVVRASVLMMAIQPQEQVEQLINGHPEHLLYSYFQVMTSLGMQLIIAAAVVVFLNHLNAKGLHLLRIPLGWNWKFLIFRFPPAVLFVLGCICIGTTEYVIHTLQKGDPASVGPLVARSPRDVALRLAYVPGLFGQDFIQLTYPVLPWLGICFLGCATGYELWHNAESARWRAGVNALILLVTFSFIRVFGGAALNLRGLPLHEGEDHKWNSFWMVCKYPPSIAYVSLFVGIGLLLLFLFFYVKRADRLVWRVLIAYGKSPLMFYLSHFWIITTLEAVIFAVKRKRGVDLPYVVLLWLLVIVLEFPIVHYYSRFKFSKSSESLWRLL